MDGPGSHALGRSYKLRNGSGREPTGVDAQQAVQAERRLASFLSSKLLGRRPVNLGVRWPPSFLDRLIKCRLNIEGTFNTGRERLMRQTIPRILLWLFVINLGIAFGASLYESRITFPQWLIYSSETGYFWNAKAALQANTGLSFWVFVTTGPLTLLVIANLIAAWRAQGAMRGWWLGAVMAALADRIFTLSYFVPTMAKLMSDETLSQSEAVAMASCWGQLNQLRHVFVLVAWLLALKAFSILGRNSDFKNEL